MERSLTNEQLDTIRSLANHAVDLNMPIYLVGGVVRDMFLDQTIREVDLVLEGDAVSFARSLVKKMGGELLVHSKFGTCTWTINGMSVDLVTARKEAYTSPGVLPTIEPASITDDLNRRDFTINAMALRLDGGHFGKLIDVLDGKSDIERGMIRVLHPKSFVDDPTRMFRAIRYAGRYQFRIEDQTQKLFNSEAMNVLASISGERIRHEFDLIFEESNATSMLDELRSILPAIDGRLTAADPINLRVIHDEPREGMGEFTVPDLLTFRQTLGWVLYFVHMDPSSLDPIMQRLAFPSILSDAVRSASSLLGELPTYKTWKPSEWTFHLDDVPALSIYAVWLLKNESALLDYLTQWQFIKPHTDGVELKRRGLEPGPRFGEILHQLRAAWLDGDLKTYEDEEKLLEKLIT